MRRNFSFALVMFALVAFACGAFAATNTPRSTGASENWSIWGGTVGIHWNRGLVGDIALQIKPPTARIADDAKHHFERFELCRAGALDFRM